MKFATYFSAGRTIAAVVTEAGARNLAPILGENESGQSPMRRLVQLIGEGNLDLSEIDNFPLLSPDGLNSAPLLDDPGKIIAAPVNYQDHQEEMKQVGNVEALGFFLKSPSSVLAHGGTVNIPYTDRRFDQEGELALVISKRARNIGVNEAFEYIAGFTCLLDITMRGGEDRSARKSFDTFTPVGPYLVTPDEVGTLSDLFLSCSVNGHLRQNACIKHLIWGVPEYLAYLSSVMTLLPGDIITTGTPAGVGQIFAGDIIRLEISRVGSLSVSVSDAGAITCPTSGANRGPLPPEEIAPVRRADGIGHAAGQ